jgi:hypothetical protein
MEKPIKIYAEIIEESAVEIVAHIKPLINIKG